MSLISFVSKLRKNLNKEAEEVTEQEASSFSIPSLEEVFKKRIEAAEYRKEAMIEKAKADILKMKAGGKSDMEELMARFQLLVESAEAKFKAEVAEIEAEKLQISAKKDLKQVDRQAGEDEKQLKLQEQQAADQQKMMEEAAKLPVPQMGGVQSQGINPMLDPAVQEQLMQQKQASASFIKDIRKGLMLCSLKR